MTHAGTTPHANANKGLPGHVMAWGLLGVSAVVAICLLGLLGRWTVRSQGDDPAVFNIVVSIAVGVFTGLITGLVITGFTLLLPALNPPSSADPASQDTVTHLLDKQTSKIQLSLSSFEASAASRSALDQRERFIATATVAATCLVFGWVLARRR